MIGLKPFRGGYFPFMVYVIPLVSSLHFTIDAIFFVLIFFFLTVFGVGGFYIFRHLLLKNWLFETYVIFIVFILTCIKIFFVVYIPEIYYNLEIYISLLVMMPVFLNFYYYSIRISSFWVLMFYLLRIGIFISLAVVLITLFREAIGSGLITLRYFFDSRIMGFVWSLEDLFFNLAFVYKMKWYQSLWIFQEPAGLFFIFAFLAACYNLIFSYTSNSRKL